MITMAIAVALREAFGAEHKVFFNSIPADAEVAIMVDSPIPGFEIDPDLPGYYNDMIEVVIRHNRTREGIELCQKVTQALECANKDLSEYHFNYIRAVTAEPAVYPTAKSGLKEFAVRFEFSCYKAI